MRLLKYMGLKASLLCLVALLAVTAVGQQEVYAAHANQEDAPFGVSRFVLVNAETDLEIAELTEGYVINLATTPTRFLTIRVDNEPSEVGSVVFRLDGPITRDQVESRPPYSLYGDLPGAGVPNDYNGVEFVPGSYVISATPYSGANGSGDAGGSRTVSFTVIDEEPTPTYTPSITSLTWIDANTDQVIGTLNDGDTVSLSALPSNFLTIVANTDPEMIGSVRFVLNGGAFTQLENQAPYSLTGELPNGSGGFDYNGYVWTAGTYTLEVTPYNTSNAGGIAGATYTVTFTITE